MAHGWDSYFPNLQPPPTNPRPLEVSSGPEGNLSQPIENFTAHHDLSNMVVSQEAVSTNSDFGSNLYTNSAPTSDCEFSYYSDIPWQADEHQSVKDESSKCENGDLSNLTAGGLTTSSHFPSSFAADLQEITEDCEMLPPSFLEDYSDVSSCSDTDINDTEIRHSCKYMKSAEPKTASHDNLITTKHSPSEWPFTPTGNMSISADIPTSQMSETPLILPIPSELHDKAREMADCAEEKMETKENPTKCVQKHPTLASSETLEDQEDTAGTEQKLKFDIEEERVPIQVKELNITIGSHKNMAEDVMDRYPEDCGKEHTCPKVDKCQEEMPLICNHLTSFLSVEKDLDVKIQETGTKLLDTIQDKEVCVDKETIDPNQISSPGLHENGMDDTSDTLLSSTTECPGLFDNISHSQDTIHELEDNIDTLEAVEITNGPERTFQGISHFQYPAQPESSESSESCRQDIICINRVEDIKCNSMDACYNKQLSDSGRVLEPLAESESIDPLHQPKLYTTMDEEKTLPSSVLATERHEEDASETMKEFFQETSATFEQPDPGMLYGEPLSRADSPCEDHETSHSDQDSPVASLENSSITHLEVQGPELKHSLQLQKKLQPIIVLKTLKPVNDVKEFRCTECQYSTQHVDNLIEHHHSHSQHEFKFCPTCNIYLQNDLPSKHVCDVTGYVQPERRLKKKRSYKCNSCSHISTKFYQHVQHMRTHTGRTPFKCNGCGQYFSQSSCMYRHMRIPGRCRGTTHKKSATQLNIKSKTTKPKHNQKVVECKSLPDCYVKLVDISRTHVCPFCSKTFTSSKIKNKHVCIVHKVKGVQKGMETSGADELGKYKCPLCPRVFKYSYNRARHLRRCIKEQTNGTNWKIGSKFQCPLCKANFSFANNRTRHIQNNCLRDYLRTLARTNTKTRTEKKEPPSATTDLGHTQGYKCSLCPARYFHASGKYKHMKKHELYKLTGKTVGYRSFPILREKQENISSKTTVKCTDTATSNQANHSDDFSCSFCGKGFSTSLLLKEHERNHKGDRPYRCLECGKGFRRRNHLSNHKTTHQRTIQCTVCKMILPTIGELIKHRKTHLKRGKLKCPDCPLQFDYPVYLLRHLASHKRESKNELVRGDKEMQVKPELPLKSLKKLKASQCSLCKDVFQDPKSLRKHCLKHITESSCPFCQVHFNSRRSLVRHMERHSGDKPLPCNACGKRFHRNVNLNLHKKTCSASKMEVNQLEVVEVVEKPAEKGRKLLHCTYCPRTFNRRNRLKKHHYGHRTNTLLTCSKCGHFYGRTKLSQHEKNCNGTTTIDQRGKSLPNKVEEKVEKKLHRTTGTRTKTPHICPHCHQKFQYRSFLLRHLVSHKDKSFACDHCGRQYGNKSMCNKHEALCGGLVRKDDSKINSSNQPRLSRQTSVKEAKEKKTEYKCTFCTKTFLKARNLRRHILTHTEVKPYRCKACDSCFSRYDHLKLHQTRCKGKRQRLEVCLPKISLDAVGKGWQKQGHNLAIAEEQTFECNLCLKIFTCKSNLDRHVSMLHNQSAFSSSRRKKIALSTRIDRLDGRTTKILEPFPIKKQRNACIYCPRSFKSSWQLRVHTRLHTGEKPFLCDMCGERFIRRDYLMRHSLKCNPKKGGNDLLPCNKCKDLFPKESLEIHQIDCSNAPSVSGDLQKTSESTSNGFSCAYCNSTFLIFSQLQQHFLNAHKQDTVKSPVPTTSLQQQLSNIVSIKEEPLDATNDDKQINGDGKILFDGSTHVDDAEEKPFPCSFCNLRFKNRSGLSGHLRIHLKSAPFSCLKCKKGFWNKNQQRSHLRKCKRLEMFSKKNVGLKSSDTISSEIDSSQNDSVLVFKEGSKTTYRGTGVLQTTFSCKDNSEDSPQEDPVQSSSVEKKAVHYQCSECDQSFTDGLLLISHLEDHGRVEQEKNRNTCPECGKVCNNGANLNRHMKVHGIEKTYPCLECSKRFTTLRKLLVHKKNHKKQTSPFVCRICSQRCWTNKSLQGHYSENHPNELHFCKLCSKRYTSKKSLIRHYKMRHHIWQLDQYIDCSENESIDHGSIEVNASGCSDKDIQTDEDGDSENDIENSDSDAAPYFPCHVCGKTFLTSENLEDHQRCHLGEKPHECAECGKCFFQASQLLQHQRTHKSEFQCQTCHRGFVSLFALRKHKHSHGKSRPYRCSKCDLSFTGHSQLAEHMAMHREDNFPCDICNRTFSCKSSRAEHRKSHSAAAGDLPPLTFEEEEMDNLPLAQLASQQKYRCGVCHECFKDPQELSEHGCLAAKERPFSCADCDQYFLHESHLKKHKAINHGPPSYEYLCHHCHIQFSSERSYLWHANKHHCDVNPGLIIKEEEDAVENSSVPQTVPESQLCNKKNADSVGVQNPLPTQNLTYECKICELTFSTKSKMKRHERYHYTATTQFECTGCGQNFIGSEAFQQHHCSRSMIKGESTSTKKSPGRCETLGEEEEVDVTGEDVFSCFACSEQFSTKSCLLEHQNEHHPKILKCEICGKTFKERRDLIQHERTHLTYRDAKSTVKKKTQLSCFQCPTMFDTVQEMAVHMKTHCEQDLGHHRCDMCYKSFSQVALLKQHQESHVGQVVYECTECDKAFAFLHLLEEHQLTHAGPSK